MRSLTRDPASLPWEGIFPIINVWQRLSLYLILVPSKIWKGGWGKLRDCSCFSARPQPHRALHHATGKAWGNNKNRGVSGQPADCELCSVIFTAPCFHSQNMHLLEPLLSWSDVCDVIYILEFGRGMCLQAFWSRNQVSIMHMIHIAIILFSFLFWNHFKATYFLSSPKPKMSIWRIMVRWLPKCPRT